MTVLPITSQAAKVYPFETFIPKGEGGLQQEGKVKANQIRTVDKKRLLGNPLGPLISHELMVQVEKAIKIHLGL